MQASGKCVKCQKTAYAMESILYDGATYHKACFKCLECGASVSLGKVAMIQGDLYCKNCFVQKFKVKGSYHIFGTKTLPKSMRGDDAGSGSPKSSSPRRSSPPTSSTNLAKPVHRHTQSESPAASVSVAERKKEFAAMAIPAVPEIPEETKQAAPPAAASDAAPAPSDASADPPAAASHDADGDTSNDLAVLTEVLLHIQHRSEHDVRRMVKYHGPRLAFGRVDGKTMIQVAFTQESSVDCGEALLNELEQYVTNLESQLKTLRNKYEPSAAPAATAPAASDPTS